MNKAEKARMAELEAALESKRLSRLEFEKPKPMTREEIEAVKVEVQPSDRGGGYSRGPRMVALGYGFNDYINGPRVYPMWSDGIYHGRDNHTGDSASQTMGVMYRTRREAAIALYLSLAKQFGERLAGVRRLIATNPGAPNDPE